MQQKINYKKWLSLSLSQRTVTNIIKDIYNFMSY